MKTNNENPTFISFPKDLGGIILDESAHPSYPLQYFNFSTETNSFQVPVGCSVYIYCYDKEVYVYDKENPEVVLTKGMYLSMNNTAYCQIHGHGAAVIVLVFHAAKYTETDFRAYRTIGGPIEKEGRLSYIDGCTDSLLIPPVKLGDPCFNHLHFPENIDQTPHTHPSHRIGIVAKGEGECITPFGNLPLTEGMIFVIKEYDGKTKAKGTDGKLYPAGTHSFKTTNSSMDVIAFHPDSDFGPTDVNHPMINRTIVEGVSANTLTDIQTKKK